MGKKTAIQSAQMRQLFSASKVSLISSILLAAILAYMQLDVIDSAVVITWFSFIVLASLSRAALVLAYQHSPVEDDAATHVWLVRFRLCVLVAGVVWGSAGFLLFPANHLQHQMFLVVMLAGLTSGAVVSFSADLASAIVFSVSVLVPLGVRLFVAGDSLSVAMGMAIMLYLGFMLMNLRQINRNTYENIVLRLEAAAREETVRASEERYRLLLSHSPVGIFHYDTNLVVTYCNNRFADMMLNSIEHLIGVDMKLLKDQAILPALRKALEGEMGYYEGHYRATFSDADGWVDMTCAPFQDDEGKTVGGIAIVQDITERKQAETDLRIAATAFESQEGMIITDANNVILRVNRAFTNITGYTPEEIIGKNPHILSSGQHDAIFYAAMWESINNTGAWEGEIWNRRKNGEVYPEHLTITAVISADGIVTNYVATLTDITVSKAAADEIQHLAFYDPLTHLPNRRLLLDRLQQALASSARSGREGALLFIDLDNFKTLNDTLGHDVGDLLLQQVAQRLESCVREGDTVARLGGDEFVVMLEDLSEQPIEAAAQTETIGEKILATLNQPYQLAKHGCRSTPSIGATLFNAHDLAIDELLKQADIAMYQAKKAGRNALRFFDPQMQASINARVAMEADLRLALSKNQFKLYYQLQATHNRQAVGAEVLIRWQHPQRGLVSPVDFIPLAEETGLILPIGQWVLETACAQIKQWEQKAHTQHLQLAVNVSARQFHQADFVEQVRQAVLRSGINPDRLKLELTESLVLDDIDDTVLKMHALRKISVRFSMDDFGTGHSSLAYLTQLPLDQLKIDQSFVRNIGVKPTDAVIVQTIIGMANNLGMEVIAEGVETEAQRAFLEQHSCPVCQGYLFSKPVPLEEFEMLLKRG